MHQNKKISIELKVFEAMKPFNDYLNQALIHLRCQKDNKSSYRLKWIKNSMLI